MNAADDFLIFFAVSANFTNILLNFNSVFCSGFVLYGNVDAGFRELIRDRLASLFVKDVKINTYVTYCLLCSPTQRK